MRSRQDDVDAANHLLRGPDDRYVAQMRVGPGDVQLLLSDGLLLRLAGPVRVAGTVVEQPQALAGVSALLPLISGPVVVLDVAPDGTLHLLVGDTTVDCPPDAEHEAWEATNEDGALLVCTPGGQLAVWGPVGGGRPPEREPDVTLVLSPRAARSCSWSGRGRRTRSRTQ